MSHDLTKFAVIAVYFNPVRYQSRYDLYRQFEERMLQSDVFFFTVECIFESALFFGLTKQVFEVTQSNNPRHLQVTAPSIMWMKENLINVAVRHLPEYIEYVSWIDTDLEFDRLDWTHLAINELQRYPIVQLFEVAHFLGPNGKNEIMRHDYSFVYSIKHNKPIDPRRYKEWYPHPGYAWAMRRTAFNAIGGLCEFAILGSGDLHFAYALLNRIKETFPTNLNEDYQRSAITWGERVAELAHAGQHVGYVPVNVWHYWHGSRDNRGYIERWSILERHQFAPSKDLQKNSQTGIIALANKRDVGQLQMSIRLISLERDIVAYFLSRKEDNKVNTAIPSEPIRPKPVVIKPTSMTTGTPSRFMGYQPIPPPSFSSYRTRPTPIWSSASAGSYVGDCDQYWVNCTCAEHHDCAHETDCPCCIYYGGEHEGEHHHDHHNDSCDDMGHGQEHHHRDEHDCSNNPEYEGDHGQQDGNDFHIPEGEEYVSPNTGEFDQDYSTGGTESNDYGGAGEYQDGTTDYASPGSFY